MEMKAIILSLFLLSTSAQMWERIDRQLNESFHGILETLGSGKDPRFFYIIEAAKPNDEPFRLNKYTGALEVLPGGLDYDLGPEYQQYNLTIQVTSQSDKNMNEHVHVNILVLDVNDVSPVFTNVPSTLMATIPTNAAIGTFVFQMNASDSDASANIQYSINDFASKGRFTVDPVSGVVRVGRVGRISHVQGTRYELEVEATDLNAQLNLPQVARSRLIVIVGHAVPQFFEPVMHVYFEEEQAVGSRAHVVQAKSFQGQSLTYSLLGPNIFTSAFKLDSATGVVSASRILNYDKITEPRHFNFTVVAAELGPPYLSASGLLTISLLDINDNIPSFQLSDYVLNATKEDVGLSELLFDFQAIDLDSNENGEIRYELMPDIDIASSLGHRDDYEYFIIDPRNGELKPSGRLDFDKKLGRTYRFRVTARDSGHNGSLSTFARVRVPMINTNDEYPEFLVLNKEIGFIGYIMEDAPVGENIVVGVIRADDPDGDMIQYDIAGYETKPPVPIGSRHPFEVDRKSGYIRQVGPLATGVSAYILNVSAEDDGSCCSDDPRRRHKNFTTFIVNVQDVNNNRPRLNCSACNGTAIKEGRYNNFTVCRLFAHDLDLGDNGVVRFSMRGKDFFQVDPVSGTVYAIDANLDRERSDNRHWIYMTGIAEDRGRPRLSDYCSFQITIEDANDNRPMLDIPMGYNFHVSSLTPRTVVAYLSAIDKDIGPNGQVSFFVNPDSPLANFFVISSNPEHNSGVVRIADGVDENQLRSVAGPRRTIQLPLILRDHGVPELTTNVSITIEISKGGELRPAWDENLSTVVVAINETAQPGFVVANLTAKVPGHPNSPIRYLIPTRDTSSDVFTERIPFWFETESSDSRSVRIYLYKPVNAEMKDRYVFTVRATSSQSQLSIDRLINVTILDVNDEVPVFLNTDPDNNCYYGSFPENPDRSRILVATAKADDYDLTAPNNVIARYELRYTDDEDNGKFMIDPQTGEIWTNSTEFDFESKQFYSIRIVAFDGAPSPLNGYRRPNVGETFLRIQILDVNDNAPRFEKRSYNTSILEHSEKGTLVMNITAADPDQWDILTYEIMSGDPNGAFIVHGSCIYVNNPLKLDASATSEYHLVYRAFDNRYQDLVNVTITILDRVDKPPKFLQPLYITQPIVENDPYQGRVLIQVEAEDFEGKQLHFSLAGNQSSHFMNAKNEISVSRPLDHDRATGGNSPYMFNVEAYDDEGRQLGLFGSTIVQVPVVDVNDNEPQFVPETLHGEIKEMANEVQTVCTVRAFDADGGLNGEVVYKILRQPEPRRFEMDERGQLRTVFGQSFKRELPPTSIPIVVEAADRGTPSLSSTATVLVDIIDVNNHSPVCSSVEQTVEMFEDAASDVPIAMVAASDEDDPLTMNSFLEFSLDEASKQYFEVKVNENIAFLFPIEGIIDYEQLSVAQRTRDPKLEVLVTVNDRGSPVMPAAVCKVVVSVRNSNDNAPSFEPRSDSIAIKENVPLKTKIFRNFTVTDVDSSSNKFTFRISDQSNRRRQFAISSDSQHSNQPVVTVVERLDREMQSEYRLEILAVDDFSPELTGTATLSIMLIDVNNHPPHLKPLEETPIVYERQIVDTRKVLAKLEAEDPDTDLQNGGSFGFELDCNYNPIACDWFNLEYDYAFSIARLYVRNNGKQFDRRVRREFKLPVLVWDNAAAGGRTPNSLSYRDFVTVLVGGGNFSPHKGSHKEIDLLLYTDWLRNADMNWLTVGKPFAEDDDDWDFAEKQVKIESVSHPAVMAYMPDIGQIVMKTSAIQPGSYDISFRISDPKYNSAVISTARVNVRLLQQSNLASQHLHSIRFGAVTPREIVQNIRSLGPVKRRKRETSYMENGLERLRQTLALIFGIDKQQVVVISVTDVPPIPSWKLGLGPRQQATDVFFTITDDFGRPDPKFTKYFVTAKLLARKRQVLAETGLELTAAPGDACSPDPVAVCPDSDSCFTTVHIDDLNPQVIDANSTAFVGIRASLVPSCAGCPASQPIPTGQCQCIEGRGTCLRDGHAGGCRCKPPFDGPRCEMTSRSFQWPGGGYIVLPIKPAPQSCDSGSFEMEITPNQTDTDVLVVYLGANWLVSSNQTSPCPYLMLEIVAGKPHMTIDLCSSSAPAPTVMRLENIAIVPGLSFKIRVSWEGSRVTMMSPDCSSICSVSEQVAGPMRLLSGTHIALVGGKPLPGEFKLNDMPVLKETRSENFSGCLRNLWINMELYDFWLAETDSAFGRTTAGCPNTYGSCNIPEATTASPFVSPNDGRMFKEVQPKCNDPTISQCATSQHGTPLCRCRPGYTGRFCELEPLPHSFAADSYMQWEMLADSKMNSQSSYVEIQVSFRSRDEDGILFWVDSAQILSTQDMSRRHIDEPDHIALVISSGRIAARIQMPPMKADALLFRSLDSPKVGDGEWHTAVVILDFTSCSLRLKLDHGEGTFNNMLWSLPDSVCNVHRNGPSFLLGSSGFWYAGGRPDAIGSRDLQLDNACLMDIRFNGYQLPMTGESSSEVAKILKSKGVTGGCSAIPLSPAPQDCSQTTCPPNSHCIAQWRQMTCQCPTDLVPMLDKWKLDKCPIPEIYQLADPCDWSPNNPFNTNEPPCAFGVCRNNDQRNGSSCDCFSGYYGPRCLPVGSIPLETPEESISQGNGLQIAAIVVPIVVGLALIIILVWFICAVSSKRRAKQKAAAIGINAPGNYPSVSEAELLADAVLGQSMAPVDNDAAGEEDVDVNAYDLSRLKQAIMEKQRNSLATQQHQMQQFHVSNPSLIPMGNNTVTMPPPYVSVVGDLDRVLAARLAAADKTLEQPSSLAASKVGGAPLSNGSTEDELSLASTEDGENAAEQNLDLSFLARLGGPFSSLTRQMGVES